MQRWRTGTRVAALAALLVSLGCSQESDEPRAASGAPKASARPSAASPTAPTKPAQGLAPNLILITMDTTRADALGVYDQARRTSPNIDRLSWEGVVFDQVTTSSPETLPAHATILTGKWPYAHGVRANAGYVLSDSNLTLAETLRHRGYRTGAEVAAKVLRKETAISQGFDHYAVPGQASRRFSERGAKATTAGAIQFVRQNKEGKFFLWVHYFDPHDPYEAPPEFAQRSADSPYHAEVASMDHEIGALVTEIERLGLRDSTLVVLTADHGEGLNEHGERTHSMLVYDSTMRVPLILWGLSSLPKNVRIPGHVRTVDILPTVLDYLELPSPNGLDGVSLRPVVESPATDPELTGYGEAHYLQAIFGLSPLRFVREGRWKYIHKVNPELYDVTSDPGEKNNVIATRPEVAERLRARLEEMLRSAPTASGERRTEIDAETAAQLIELGYAAESPEVGDEVESLDVTGPDPMERVADGVRASEAQSLIGARRFEEALVRLEQVLENNPESVHTLGLQAVALLGLSRIDESVQALKEIFRLSPCYVLRRKELIRTLTSLRRYGELLEVLEATTTRCAYDVRTQNNYAWALATIPEESLRDGAKAVAIAEKALRSLERPDPLLLDTLSAAQAEMGNFQAARQTVDEALRLLAAASTPRSVVEEIEAHRRAYEKGEPVRDPASGSP